MKTKFLPLLFFLIIFVPLLFTISSGIEHARGIALFISIIILWFTELVPLPVTGLLVPVLVSLYGIMSPQEAFRPFGSDILFLFIGCFFLARSMQKHGWDKRMAYFILASKIGGKSPDVLIGTVALICWVLSMWVSNTATCAMMTPICLGIISIFDAELIDQRERESFSARILLSCAFASSIGGLATPIGSPPNLIALQFLKESGVHVGFFQWVAAALPVSFIMLLMLFFILRYRYPVKAIELGAVRIHFRAKLKSLGPLRREELQVAAVFSLAVFLWIVPGILAMLVPESEHVSRFSTQASMSVVGIASALILFLLPTYQGEKPSTNLVWSDAHQIDWGTIFLFGGGLALGAMLNHTGLAEAFGNQMFFPEKGVLLFALTAVLFAIVMSEFASNTASASIVIPIILAVLAKSAFEGVGAAALVVGSSMGASFGFMLPVSTPPNAIIYGTGRIALRKMAGTGFLFDISGAVIIVLSLLFLFPLVF